MAFRHTSLTIVNKTYDCANRISHTYGSFLDGFKITWLWFFLFPYSVSFCYFNTMKVPNPPPPQSYHNHKKGNACVYMFCVRGCVFLLKSRSNTTLVSLGGRRYYSITLIGCLPVEACWTPKSSIAWSEMRTTVWAATDKDTTVSVAATVHASDNTYERCAFWRPACSFIRSGITYQSDSTLSSSRHAKPRQSGFFCYCPPSSWSFRATTV